MNAMTEPGFCMCGCGGRTKIATYTNKGSKIFKGCPLRYINGHQGITHGRSKTAEYHREHALRNHYGLSLDEFEAMAEAQDWKCYICREHRRLQVDHNHVTGAIRKLLCNGCNSRLGVVEDPILLERSIHYLKEHS